MTLKSEVAELRYEVAELSSGELRLTFTTGYVMCAGKDGQVECRQGKKTGH